MTAQVETCFLCDVPLVAGVASLEHIIPNALGGWLKSRALLCTKHNNTTGAHLDAALIKPLREVANAIGFERDRGETPGVVVTVPSGEKYVREYDGNMWPVGQRPKVEVDGREVTFSITSPDIKDARKHLEGLKRKYPNVDVEAHLANAKETVEIIREPMSFSISGLGTAEMFRALVKIAVSYYLHIGGQREFIRECIDVVRTGALPPVERVGSMYALDPLPARTEAITNVLAVTSDEHGRLCAYIELLRAFRFTVRMSDSYTGPPIRAAYAHDLLARNELQVDVAALRGPWIPEDWDRGALERELDAVRTVIEPREVTVRSKR